ncbi:helix-turn-helix domain-containing protein [Psychrobacillus sp.]|uniref:helix-turn-helix domain-containing protein n=1 Tax=Psychrobacillus sp. TaxID=1871623 RepID=UPI0028BD5BDB|nr:helix-turn-helix domain-containing protein [Psychrobacillus sp.]
MSFHELLLIIIHKFHGERSSTAAYYLLKGKKSGQTIQDVTYFKLHPYFSLYPKLLKEEYNDAISTLVEAGMLEIIESFIFVTEKGLMQIDTVKEPMYNGWIYRGNEQLFWSRLELIVQTLSQFQANEKRFIPNQKNPDIHQFVRNYLRKRDYQSQHFISSFKEQLKRLLETSILDDSQRELFVYRLSGCETSGLTWEQLARHYNASVLDVRFQFVECLHIVLNELNGAQYPDLIDLAQDMEVATPLTESAIKTNQLFAKGYSIEKIAEMRFLKINTIEDHVIEIVSANHNFPTTSFISAEQLERVVTISQLLQTKKLKLIREHIPELSYFQIRIGLTKGEEANG